MKLNKCIKCGGDAYIYTNINGNVVIFCDNCGHNAEAKNLGEAVKFWNTPKKFGISNDDYY